MNVSLQRNRVLCHKDQDIYSSINVEGTGLVPIGNEIAPVEYMSSRSCLLQPHIFYSKAVYPINGEKSIKIAIDLYDTKQRQSVLLEFDFDIDIDLLEGFNVEQLIISLLNNEGDVLVQFVESEGGSFFMVMNVITKEVYQVLDPPCYALVHIGANSSGVFLFGDMYDEDYDEEEEVVYRFSVTEEEHKSRNYENAFKPVNNATIDSKFAHGLNFAGFFMCEVGFYPKMIYYYEDTSIDFFELFPILQEKLPWNGCSSVIMHKLDISNKIACFTVIDEDADRSHTITLNGESFEFVTGTVWGALLTCDEADTTVPLPTDDVFNFTNRIAIHTFARKGKGVYITVPVQKENVLFFFDTVSDIITYKGYLIGTDVFNRVLIFNTKTRVCEVIDVDCDPFDKIKVRVFHNNLYLTLCCGFNAIANAYDHKLFAALLLGRHGFYISGVTNLGIFELEYVNENGIPLTQCDHDIYKLGDVKVGKSCDIEQGGMMKSLYDDKLCVAGVKGYYITLYNVDLVNETYDDVFCRGVYCDSVLFNPWGNTIVTFYEQPGEDNIAKAVMLTPEGEHEDIPLSDSQRDDVKEFIGPNIVAGHTGMYHIDFGSKTVQKIHEIPEGFKLVGDFCRKRDAAVYTKNNGTSVAYHTVRFDGNMNPRVFEKTVTVDDFKDYTYKPINVSKVRESLQCED
ncbi:hypothetical protein PCE1_001528 [Barthelona sp. PCE]